MNDQAGRKPDTRPLTVGELRQFLKGLPASHEIAYVDGEEDVSFFLKGALWSSEDHAVELFPDDLCVRSAKGLGKTKRLGSVVLRDVEETPKTKKEKIVEAVISADQIAQSLADWEKVQAKKEAPPKRELKCERQVTASC